MAWKRKQKRAAQAKEAAKVPAPGTGLHLVTRATAGDKLNCVGVLIVHPNGTQLESTLASKEAVEHMIVGLQKLAAVVWDGAPMPGEAKEL